MMELGGRRILIDPIVLIDWPSGKLLREVITTGEGATATTQTLDFFYDANGTPLALKVSDATYYYVTNLQGDVIQLVDSTGTAVAAYEYDPYGNIVFQSGNLADLNPLRYRGYYYDAETGFYYLQSRYYDPKIGRFINADSYASTGDGLIGVNMFAYCGNDPINYGDPSGERRLWQELFYNHDYGYIHRAVQAHILLLYNTSATIVEKEYVLPGVGRADIYMPETGEVWEIKHGGSAEEMIELRIQQADSQVNRYINATTGLIKGRAGAFCGFFTINCNDASYSICYFTPQEGVILYFVMPCESKLKSPFLVYEPASQRSSNYNPSEQNLPFYALPALLIGGVPGSNVPVLKKSYDCSYGY